MVRVITEFLPHVDVHISERRVRNLLLQYDALPHRVKSAVPLSQVTTGGEVFVLALYGVWFNLWVLRECLSGKTLWSCHAFPNLNEKQLFDDGLIIDPPDASPSELAEAFKPLHALINRPVRHAYLFCPNNSLAEEALARADIKVGFYPIQF
jgi:hypothetical protein